MHVLVLKFVTPNSSYRLSKKCENSLYQNFFADISNKNMNTATTVYSGRSSSETCTFIPITLVILHLV